MAPDDLDPVKCPKVELSIYVATLDHAFQLARSSGCGCLIQVRLVNAHVRLDVAWGIATYPKGGRLCDRKCHCHSKMEAH